MKNKILLVVILILSIVLFSCLDEKKGKTQNDYHLVEDSNSKIVNIVFPDTVSINNDISGELKYDLQLDTIEPSELIERFIFLYVSAEKVLGGIDNIKKTEHNIFIDTLGSGAFLFNAKFESLGVNQITLVLQDVIMVKSDNPDEAMLEIIDETSIIRDIFVKE